MFINLFIGVLMVLVVIFLVIDVVMVCFEDCEWIVVLIIILMVVCSVIFCFWQEWKVSEVIDLLMKMVKNICFVKWFLGSEEVDIMELVLGDVVCFVVGDMILVDICIIELKDLFVSQVLFIGEFDLVEKFFEINGRRYSYGSVIEFDNICYMGFIVISGFVKGIVFGMGNDIYFGMIV